MIVECVSCNSRFRLDESKITGRGARVRCRKCGEPIIVMKPDAAAARAEAALGAEGLDLRSIVREAMEGPADAAPQAPEPPGVAEPQSDLEKALAEAAREADEAADAGTPAPGGPETREHPPAEGATIEFGAEEELTFPAAGRDGTADAGTPAPPAAAGPPPLDAPAPSSQFMMSTADSLDFLKADYDKEEQKAALDISGSLRIAPAPGADEGKAAPPPGSQRVSPPAPPPGPPPAAAGAAGAPPAQDGGEVAGPGAGPGRPDAAAAGAAATAAAPRGAATAPARPPAADRRPAPRKPALKRRQSSQLVRPSVIVLLLLFFALAGGGAYLGFTGEGQRMLRGLVPQIESLWPGGGKPVSRYTVGNLIGYYESGGAGGRMFVIKGQVTNEGRQRRTGMRIRATLLDSRNAAIAGKTVYAGNVFSADVLRKAPRAKIEEAMSNPIGGGLANMDIAPGKSIPFMVVFFDVPDGVDSYRLEPGDAD